MTTRSGFGGSTLSIEAMWRIEDACQRFEAALKREDAPTIEDTLGGTDGAERARLLYELVQLELDYRRRRGESPALSEYEARFPGEAQALDGAFGAQEEETTVIGKYRIISKFPGSGQADVYRAVHPELGEELVIKLSRHTLGGSRGRVDHIVGEGKMLAELRHPHMARVYDLGVHEDRPFLVMEYIRGRHLEQYVQGRELSAHEAASLVAKVARALSVAHGRGVVHQDLKPQNIVIDESGEPRVIDFGLARLQHAWGDDPMESGIICGTPAYMPPEQARGDTDQVDQRSDVFALGAVLYRLLVGRAPFDTTRTPAQSGSSVQDPLALARECAFDRQALRRRGVSRRLAAACLKAMAPEPTERYGTAEAFADELGRCTRAPVQWRRAAAVTVVGLVVLLAGWYASTPPRTSDDLSGAMTVLLGGVTPLEGNPRRPPLRAAEGFRVAVEMSQSAYIYLLWIGSEGRASPVYPWEKGQWTAPVHAARVEELELPQVGKAFKIPEGESGMETLLLLAREKPLPDELDLPTLLADVPSLELKEPQGVFEFDDWRLKGLTRGDFDPTVFDAVDPVLRRNDILRERLAEHFSCSYAVTFANLGK